MTLQPPQGRPQQPYAQLRIPQPGAAARAAQPPSQVGYGVNQTPVQPLREVTAPTLLQFWRSDSRVIPGRTPPKWAGRVAFWVGLVAAVLFFVGGFVGAALLVALASPLAVVAVFFALIALIAGIGRGLGLFGLVFALAGSSLFWGWLASVFG